ncbi:unannotated protein [freshwater metagenome]|uniref:Unannotated protein n=1 Tax=freshwater metagenome TaxID=449393 RepID=A0A6J7FHU6_9ZZZZ|nr:hypothetical protein [Actinomycetota bacterium]
MGETIVARLKVIGARRFRKDMDESGDSVDRLGKSADGTRRPFADMQRGSLNVGRGLKALAVVCAITAGAQGIGLLVQATGAGIIALGALGIAALGAGAVLAGFAMGATKRFEQMADVGGSTANELKNRFGEFKTLLSDELGPAFDPVFQGLAKALGPIGTLVREIAPAFKSLGSVIGTSISQAATGLAGMGPEINGLIAAVADLVPVLLPALLQLFRIFLLIATAAMPYLIDGLQWLTTQLEGVSRATIDGGIAWAFQTLADVFGTLAGVVRALAPVFAALMGGLDQIADGALPGVTSGMKDIAKAFEAIVASGGLQTFGEVVGTVFAFAAKIISAVVTELQRVGALGPAITAITIGLTALGVAMFALSLNPLTLIVVAVIAVGTALIYAYKRFEGFRNAVDGAWRILKSVGSWIAENWKLVIGLLTGPIGGAIILIVSNFGKIKSTVTSVVGWVRDKFMSMVGFLGSLPGKVGSAVSGLWDGIKNGFRNALNWIIGKWNGLEFTVPKVDLGPLGAIGGGTIGVPDIPLLAEGGTVRGMGSFVTGEAGPELNTVRADGSVRVQPLSPNQRAPAASSGRGPAPTPLGERLLQPVTVKVEISKRQLAEAMAEIAIDTQNGVTV